MPSVELEGRGGDGLPAALYLPDPEGDTERTGVVLLAPPYELGAALEARAAELVEAGLAVCAPDLLARERRAGAALPDEPPDRRALADVDAALARLAAEPGVGELAVVGLGTGGTLAFLSGCHSDRPAAVASLDGRVVRDALSAEHPLQPLEMALNLGCPFLWTHPPEGAAAQEAERAHARAVLSQFARTFDIVSLTDERVAWRRVVEFLRECTD